MLELVGDLIIYLWLNKQPKIQKVMESPAQSEALLLLVEFAQSVMVFEFFLCLSVLHSYLYSV